jgi:hypothetical protein
MERFETEAGFTTVIVVITIADSRRVLTDRPRAEQGAGRLLETLIAIDDFRGVGRIYVP